MRTCSNAHFPHKLYMVISQSIIFFTENIVYISKRTLFENKNWRLERGTSETSFFFTELHLSALAGNEGCNSGQTARDHRD